MKKSMHAIIRQKQRGISGKTLDCLLHYGEISPARDGAYQISLSNQTYNERMRCLRDEIHQLERARKKKVILKNDEIITIYRMKCNS